MTHRHGLVSGTDGPVPGTDGFTTFYDRLRGLLKAIGSLLPSRRAIVLVILLAAGGALGIIYVATQHTVFLRINGTLVTHRTHETWPNSVLHEMGITLQDGDILQAPSEEEILGGEPIALTIARHVMFIHDGSVADIHTHAINVASAIAETRVVVSDHDRLLLDGEPCAMDAPLPPPKAPRRAGVRALLTEIRRPVRLSVRRAIPLSLQDGAISIRFYTTARTVGEALFDQGIIVYDGDRIFPLLNTEITPGLVVFLERSKPLTLDVDNASRALHTRLGTVGKVLEAEKIILGDKDYVLPEQSAQIVRDIHIAVIRVYEEHFVEETPIPFETRWEPDPEVDIDQYKVIHWGQEGAERRRIQVHYENSQETSRSEEEEWIAREPLDRVIKYGTKITLRELETPDGIVTYWRKLRILATSYNAPTAGKPLGHPTWGITRVGWRARKGIIAVDRRVINMLQEMYVPGYGNGIAADTGGAIKWRRIDLCYDDDNLVLWKKWVDVYLLTPIPDAKDINWVIPNYPIEKE